MLPQKMSLKMLGCALIVTIQPRANVRERGHAGRSGLGRVSRAPSHHSMTSSARASSVGGMVRPIVLADLRLITNSNLVGN
jgi:hypothetical protein